MTQEIMIQSQETWPPHLTAIQIQNIVRSTCIRGAVRTGSMGSTEPKKFWDLLNGTLSKVDPLFSSGTRKLLFPTRPLLSISEYIMWPLFYQNVCVAGQTKAAWVYAAQLIHCCKWGSFSAVIYGIHYTCHLVIGAEGLSHNTADWLKFTRSLSQKKQG